jgi:hypothetical protein
MLSGNVPQHGYLGLFMSATIHGQTAFATLAALIAMLAATPGARASLGPKPAAALRSDADVIVVAEVVEIEVRPERSRLATGFGNYDWRVYVTLHVRDVEKGHTAAAGEKMVVECFVIKSRKFQIDYIDWESHYPIPETGQLVRAHLWRFDESYLVIDPNGFTPVDKRPLVPSAAVSKLYSATPVYSYLLPLDVWILVAVLAALVVSSICLAVNARRCLARRRAARQVGTPTSPRFSLAGLLVLIIFVAIGFAGRSLWFASFLATFAFLALAWFTMRPPKTTWARRLWWGINVAFASSIVALFLR